MITRTPAVSATLLVWLSGLVLPARAASDQKCGNAARYNGWKIRSIQVKGPFSFFPAAASLLGQTTTVLSLHQKDPFDAKKFDAGVEELTKSVKARIPFQFATVRLVVVTNDLQNCTEGAVDVQYRVFTAIVPSLSGKSFELRQAEVDRPATTGASVASSGNAASTGTSGSPSAVHSAARFLVLPSFAYDHTRHGYGGAVIQSHVPVGLFDTFKFSSSASSNSLQGDLALSGDRTPGVTALNHARWQLNANYRDVPVGGQRLKSATLAAGFFGSTKELGSDGFVLNYAASLAGGHQQNTTPGAVNSSYGDLKLLADLENRWGAQALAGAYGLQLGSTLSGRSVDFAKHILDVRYSAVLSPLPSYFKHTDKCKAGDPCDDRSAFIGAPHRPLSVEARATGGVIQTFGAVPSAERFFGGNLQTAPFIPGQPWDVRGEPYIRSVPEYRIGSQNPASFGLGGTRFYSMNLTVAKAVAGKALMPRDLGQTDFVPKLDGVMRTATGFVSDGYFGKDPAVAAVDDEVRTAGQEVAKLRLPEPASFDAAGKKLIGHATLEMKLIAASVHNITLKARRNDTNALINNLLPAIDADLTGIRNLLSSAHQTDLAEAIEERRTAIATAKESLVNAWKPQGAAANAIDAARKRADAKAARDVKPAWGVVNTILYQLNAYSVAPVGIFDVARVWPSGAGARYALGGGVRLSLVNANFTFGYAANPRRLRGEGPGALFFKLDVTELFH
jgi:hypothetical protein